ncbi:pentapeptide repeat-containing protein [Oscillatoriales cyanobacterium LEGE 11467]|uniref:Pentapeptide repeat-containing protein n=1 Tax=Zarconia navalis LEGE 11467 TaxID=1828826 RepID=A0A928VY32_9CYAN|nr:pentapeptide repeat-containing protein [Zarconia navalis]MBE9042312.1 pentapeptide repeat-containing protein [Zarconia navalis LEGE 11467]
MIRNSKIRAVRKQIIDWNRPLKSSFKLVFKALTQSVLEDSLDRGDNIKSELVDESAAVIWQSDISQIAWLLIYRALIRTLFSVVKEREELLERKIEFQEIEAFYHSLDESLEAFSFQVDSDLFTRPKELSILDKIQEPICQWLQIFGIEESLSRGIVTRLSDRFLLALTEEWQARSRDYTCLKEEIDTPFSDAIERERGWQRYRGWLQEQVYAPMFFSEIGLKQVYVSLRAYYEIKEPELTLDWERQTQIERRVIDLEIELEAWLNKADPGDALRAIAAKPGCGKSSFCQFFAAKQARKVKFPVLLVPLHQLNLEIDLIEAVAAFVRDNQFLTDNPLDLEMGESRTLIIFDGFDELKISGRSDLETKKKFLQEIEQKLEWLNYRSTRLQILLSGADFSISGNRGRFPSNEQTLHLLPYFIPASQKSQPSYIYVDPDDLLNLDLRQIWWERYSKASGRNEDEIPQVLNRGNLVAITANPLLNYFVALSFTRGKVEFGDKLNLNLIYADLLEVVYERDWIGDRSSPSELSQPDFIRLLEEIALAIWHCNGQISWFQLQRHCQKRGLERLVRRVRTDSDSGLTRFFGTFYFKHDREGNSVELLDDTTLEFTHTSFGEYLVARRIVREVQRLRSNLERCRSDPDEGWDEREALKHWAMVCGAVPLDRNIFTFIENEIQLQIFDRVSQWQQTLCGAIEFMLERGMPMELFDPRPSYYEESRLARNAEEALLAVLNLCARFTQSISHIQWPSPEVFAAWMSRLKSHRTGWHSDILLECLSFLDLHNCALPLENLYEANFFGANLTGTNLQEVDLRGANLQRVDLRDANLQRANLQGANLQGANLQRTSLQQVNLLEANLQDVNLRSVDLHGANLQQGNLRRTDLRGADLREAILLGANFRGSILRGANLRGADLRGAILRGANLRGANLQGANLLGAILLGVNLQRVSLRGAILERAAVRGSDLQGANLQGANLKLANLQRVNLQGADLLGANLQGANLRRANLTDTNFEGANLEGITLDEGVEISANSQS